MAVKNLLIIDDDPIFCFLLEKQLPKDVISFTKSFNQAKDALGFVAKEHNEKSNFLIFLDLNMPSMSGWEFLDVVKENEYGALKIVIVTSSINPEDERRATTYPDVIGFIRKPVGEKDLVEILRAF